MEKAFAALIANQELLDSAAKITLLHIHPDESTEGVFLFRYGGTTFAGDTWHENADDAMAQAEFEFGAKNAQWIDMPSKIVEPFAILSYLQDRRQ